MRLVPLLAVLLEAALSALHLFKPLDKVGGETFFQRLNTSEQARERADTGTDTLSGTSQQRRCAGTRIRGKPEAQTHAETQEDDT